MISRPQLSSRSGPVNVSMVVVLACVAAALALGAAPAMAAGACSNESLRQQSNTNPQTGKPYSTELPDCRAYEMVSPLYKQSHRVEGLGGRGFPIAPSGDAAGFISAGDFAEPENSVVSQSPFNAFVSRRGESGWTTSSAFAPAGLVSTPFFNGFLNAFSPDLRSAEVGCGFNNVPRGAGPSETNGIVCARKLGNGGWVATPTYTTVQGENPATAVDQYLGGSGASDDLSRAFVQVQGGHLLQSDTILLGSTGIYEVAGVGTSSPELRLVNVDDNGAELGIYEVGAPFGRRTGAVFGDYQQDQRFSFDGSTYHANSESGGAVFFTAMPNGAPHPGEEEEQTVYARIACNSEAASCAYVEKEGHKVAGTGRETVAVSNPSPSECIVAGEQKCPEPAVRPATYRSASADGSKVFFTTRQELLPGDNDHSANLYEYDFNRPAGEHLIQISAGSEADGDTSPGTGAEVLGVLRASSDGSHIYFVASGTALTTVPNFNGEVAAANQENLYGYDTVTNEIKFVATTDKVPEEAEENGHPLTVPAQTTPDGRYLVFSDSAQLAKTGDTNKAGTQAVYRYDFQTGELTWLSHAARGFTAKNEGKDAIVPYLPGRLAGGEPDVNDFNRAVSGCPNEGERSKTEELEFKCPSGEYDGEYVIFTTAEQLQANDTNKASDVYEWHCASPCPHPATEGTVSMISDGSNTEGTNPNGITPGGMSVSGSDTFFFTQTRLVGQDTDVLTDLYDARVEGGFAAPAKEARCSGDACQPPSKSLPTFGAAASSLFPAAGNLGAARVESLAFQTSKPKPLTLAQKLTKALKACKTNRKKKLRVACERQAMKRYAGKAKAKKKAKAIKSDRSGA